MIFDQVNGRLGIAESHCDYIDLVTSNGFTWDKNAHYSKVDSIPEAAESAKTHQGGKDEAAVAEESSKSEQHSNPSETHNDLSQGFCRSPVCQVSVVLAVLVVLVVGVAIRVRKSYGSAVGVRVPYSSELELRSSDEAAGGVTYRDEPIDPHDDDSDSEDEDEEAFEDEK
jgi:hypothetical protein